MLSSQANENIVSPGIIISGPETTDIKLNEQEILVSLLNDEKKKEFDKNYIRELKNKIKLLQTENIILKTKYELAENYLRDAKFNYVPMREVMPVINEVLPPENVRERRMLEALNNTTKQQLTPNLHFDKPLLTRDQLKEVLMWALSDEIDPEGVLLQLQQFKEQGQAFTPAQKLIDTLGTIWYSENNYIGPGKTGNLVEPASILDIVTSAPVLSTDDAAARAHDILMLITDDKVIDEILPPIASVAQQARHTGVIDVDAPRIRPQIATRQQISSRLMQSGDINPNPGPHPVPNTPLRRLHCMDLAVAGLARLRNTPYNTYVRDVVVARVLRSRDPGEVLMWVTEHVFRARQKRWDRLKLRYVGIYADTSLFFSLILSGDIESNPGPLTNKTASVHKFTDSECHVQLDEIISDPVKAESYLNLQPGTNFVNLQKSIERKGTVLLRSNLDDRTDKGVPNSNWCQVSGFNTLGAGAGGVSSRYNDNLMRYSLSNRTPRGNLKYAALGTGLQSSLLAYQDFLAAQRTHTNMVAGAELLQIFSRTPSSDFGDYVNLAKLLCYTSLSSGYIFTGTKMDCHVPDNMNRVFDFTQPIAESIYPSSLNEDATAPTVTIDAYCVTQSMYAEMLMGTQVWPQLWNPDNQSDVAVIPIDPSYSSEALMMITMCHLEFPFFAFGSAAKGNNVYTTAGNAVGTSVSVLDPLWMRGALIDGPKVKVVFVKSGNDNTPLNIGGTNIPNWNGIAAGIDILPPLIVFTGNIGSGINAGFFDALNYFSRFASITDYRAAVLLAGSIMQRKVPYFPWQLLLGGQVPYAVMTSVVPDWNAGIGVRNIAGTAGRTGEFADALTEVPMYNQFGMWDFYSRQVAPGTGSRTTVPTSGTFQQNSHLTRYGTYICILSKDVIAGKDITSMFKGNLTPLTYSIFDSSNICMDIVGSWMMDQGITNTLLHNSGQMAIDLRVDIITKIAELWNNWQTKFVGFPFLRYSLPTPTVGAGDVVNYLNRAAWLQTPLMLTNRCLFSDYFDIDLNPSVYLMDQTDISKVFTGNTIGTAVYGTAPNIGVIGGVNNVTSVTPATYLGDNAEVPKALKNLFAQAQVQHLINPNLTQLVCDVSMGLENNAGSVVFYRPVLMFMTEYLRFTSPDTDTGYYRIGTRISTGVTLPYSPFMIDVVGTRRLLFNSTSAGTLINTRPCVGIDGKGDSKFALVMQNATGVYKALATATNPF